MLEGQRIVVVVPAFREARHIGGVVASMPEWVDAICVVDDASDDATADIARRSRATVLRHETNRGVGAAIATGYRWALDRGDALCVIAGDGQMHPGDLATVALPVVRGEADYAKGNRFAAPHHARGMPLARKIGGRAFSSMTSLAIGQTIRDSQCGFTAISRRAVGLLDLADLWPRFGYPNDVLGQLAARRLRIIEVPVRPVYDGENSKLRAWHLPAIAALVARAAVRVRVPPLKEKE